MTKHRMICAGFVFLAFAGLLWLADHGPHPIPPKAVRESVDDWVAGPETGASWIRSVPVNAELENQGPQSDGFGDALPDGAVARLGTLRFRPGSVKLAVFSPDGKWIASTSGSYSASVWDAKTGKEVHCFEVKDWPCKIEALVFSPDSKRLLIGGSSLSEWDVSTGKALRRFEGVKDETILALARSSDGKTLVSAHYKYSDDPQKWDVHLWDVDSGKSRPLLRGNRDFIEGLAFSPDGKTVISTSRDGSLLLFDVNSGEEIARLGDGKQPLCRVTYAPDSKTFASGNWDGEVVIWDAERKEPIHRIKAQGQPVTSLEYSPDSRFLVSGGDYAQSVVWDVETGKERSRIELTDGKGNHATFAPDGKTLAVWGRDGAIHLWDFDSAKEFVVGRGHDHGIRSVAVAPDGKTAASAGFDGVYVWELETGKIKYHLRTTDNEWFTSVEFAPDGKSFATAGGDGFIRIGDTATGREIRRWKTEESMVFGLAYAPDGKTLYSCGYFLVSAWDPKSGRVKRRFTEMPEQIFPGQFTFFSHLAVAPDGATVYACQSDTTRGWDKSTGRERNTDLPRFIVRPFVFSPNGKHVYCRGSYPEYGGKVVAQNLHNGNIEQTYPVEGHRLDKFVRSPKGDYLAIKGDEDTVHLYQTASGKEIQGVQIRGTPWAFTPDGRYLVTRGEGTTLLVWACSKWTNE